MLHEDNMYSVCYFQPVERYFLLATNILQVLQCRRGGVKCYICQHASETERVILSFTVLVHSLNSALCNSAGYEFF